MGVADGATKAVVVSDKRRIAVAARSLVVFAVR